MELPDGSVTDAVAEFRDAHIREGLAGALPRLDRIKDMTGLGNAISSLCRKGCLVVIDEFQFCVRGPLKGLSSILKQRVDRLMDDGAPGGLLVLGSSQTEMEALMLNIRTPLYGRTTFNMKLKSWDLKTVFDVCTDLGVTDPRRWLTLWTLFGGVPYYWRLFGLIQDLNLDDS